MQNNVDIPFLLEAIDELVSAQIVKCEVGWIGGRGECELNDGGMIRVVKTAMGGRERRGAVTGGQRADDVEERGEAEGGDVAAVEVVKRFWVGGRRLQGEVRERANRREVRGNGRGGIRGRRAAMRHIRDHRSGGLGLVEQGCDEAVGLCARGRLAARVRERVVEPTVNDRRRRLGRQNAIEGLDWLGRSDRGVAQALDDAVDALAAILLGRPVLLVLLEIGAAANIGIEAGARDLDGGSLVGHGGGRPLSRTARWSLGGG